MPKTITIDNAMVTLVRVTTDPNGTVHVLCDYVLNSGTTPIQWLSQDITQMLSASDQSTALAVFNRVLQAVSTVEGVPATGPVLLQSSSVVAPALKQAPSSVGTPPPSRGR